MKQHSKFISGHLNIIQKTPEAFITNKNSDKIRRALRHNIRTSNDNIFLTGDSVYYKWAPDRRSKGSAKVLGKDGHQVLVKCGSSYVCCHPCRLSLEQSNQHQQSSQPQTASNNNSDSDSDTNTLGITEPRRQMLTATNSNVTSSDSENWHTDNYETLKQKYYSKEIISDVEDLSLSHMIIRLNTDKEDSWKQVKIVPGAGKVGKSKIRKI